MGSLLEEAKKTNMKRSDPTKITKEHIDLALAWARGEVTHGQVAKALAKKKGVGDTYRGMAIYITLARALREYINKKK